MKHPLLLLALLLVPGAAEVALDAIAPKSASAARLGGGNPFIEKYLASAERHRTSGKLDLARRDIERALERDDQHLGAWRGLAEISLAMKDNDMAVYAYHRWLSVVDNAERPTVKKAEIKEVREALTLVDETADEFTDLSEDYLTGLLDVAKEHLKKGRFHSALELFEEVLRIDRLSKPARDGLKSVRTTGGEDVAKEDIFAGGDDPMEGVDPEWLEEQNEKHSEWDDAWEDETENYKYRTNAGYLVLKTSMIAMEQMNQAYRRFFQYKMDGGSTPTVEVLIYKNRDEYREANGLPENDWTGGFFNGGQVQTYMGGQTGTESIKSMYNTLFHEAAHQFVSLTGKGGVPGWLNEAYASFFEGTTILSNGTVKWNQVATHRLFPLSRRMKEGWMASHDDGVRDESGEWATPPTAPTLRILVENEYQWGPPWYAPTWGVVYFLYNYRNPDTGIPIYRESLHEYYLSGAAGRGDPVAHFEEIVLAGKDSPVKDIDALNDIWQEWILNLEEIQLGRGQKGRTPQEFGDMALERGDDQMALEFYEEALAYDSDDFEVVWKLAQLLEELGNEDRAAALYLQFSRELELRGLDSDERYEEAQDKIRKLDPLFKRQRRLKEQLAERGMALARDYKERGLPTMAMEIARRLSASYSMPEAVDLYAEISRETGRSLARWRVAYNEFDLEGWSATGDGYRAYGKMIDADVSDDPAVRGTGGGLVTQELAADVTFEADFSLEAEMSYESGASIMGLCFGRKDSNNMHAVILHTQGYLDISTKNGGVWTVRDHRSMRFDEGWQKLRIDVVGKEVDVYMNEQYVRTIEMPNADSLRGNFGLITGVGNVHYQNIRILPRNPRDPAARIERQIKLEAVRSDASLRTAGSFSGFEPPDWSVREWLQGEPLTREELIGTPVALIFWAPYQDEVIPTTEYYEDIFGVYGKYGFQFVVLVSTQHSPQEIRDYLRENPLDGMPIGHDKNFETYKAYGLGPEGWGLPRILIIDVDGRVVWEGDPGFKIGVGWDPEAGETFLDGPIEEIVAKRDLLGLKRHRGSFEIAEAYFEEGRLREAIQAVSPLAELDAEHDPECRAAKRLLDQISALGGDLPRRSEDALSAGRPMLAAACLQLAIDEFQGLPSADLAAARMQRLKKDRSYKDASRQWRNLERAVEDAAKGRDSATVKSSLDKARGSSFEEVREALVVLDEALRSGGPAALANAWKEAQPKVELAAAK